MNMSKSFRLIIQFLSRAILGYIFLYASIDKIIDPISFSSNIDNYHISPISLNNLAALIIPWVELIIGFVFICGAFILLIELYSDVKFAQIEKYIKASSIISILLLIFFIFIISQAYYRGIDLHCGCFKGESLLQSIDLRQNMLKRIIEDILFLGLAIIVYFNKLNTEE